MDPNGDEIAYFPVLGNETAPLFDIFKHTIYEVMLDSETEVLPGNLLKQVKKDFNSKEAQNLYNVISAATKKLFIGDDERDAHIETQVEIIRTAYENLIEMMAYRAWVYGLKAGLNA